MSACYQCVTWLSEAWKVIYDVSCLLVSVVDVGTTYPYLVLFCIKFLFISLANDLSFYEVNWILHALLVD